MENLNRITGPFDAYWMKTQRARVRARFLLALAVSVGFHALLLFLQLGDAGFGLPGLELPWAERRVQATDIAARLVELPRAPVPLAVLPYVPPAPPPAVTPEIPKPPRAARPVAPRPPRVARAAPAEAPISLPRTETVEAVPVAEQPAPKPEVRPSPQPEILAQTEPQPETVNVPPPPAKPAEPEPSRKSEVESRKEEAAKQQAEAAARERAEEDARQRALALQKELEAKKQEEAEARRKAEDGRRKEEEAKRVALEAEALKRAEDAARQQAAARQKEQEEIRRKAEDGRRKEEAAKQLAEEGRRKEEAAARAAASGPAGAAPAPGAPSGREIAGKALEQLRTPGAAARVDPPRAPSPPVSGDRRRSVFGVERDVMMRMYVESWRWKIERFGALNYRPSAAWRARDNPIVTVAIRSDGSLESVHINQSSGVRELDETVRRIAQRYSPYSAFPPALALQYDVIEIRRVWFFDDTLKILEEM